MSLIEQEAAKAKKVYCEERHEYVVPVAELDWLPTIDAAPVVHVRWKYFHKQNKAVCTNCSFERDLDLNFGRAISCPNCGARMDGGEGHEAG